MRKYLMNGAVLSSVFGAVGVLKASKQGPRDWRLALMWVSWGISVAIAVGTVMEENKEQGAIER
ncbi:MAG: hypothetical protein ACXIUP_05085 [Microcella sp.]